jgi:hypothetical protein
MKGVNREFAEGLEGCNKRGKAIETIECESNNRDLPKFVRNWMDQYGHRFFRVVTATQIEKLSAMPPRVHPWFFLSFACRQRLAQNSSSMEVR